jgi:hypothetical protein
MTPQHSIELRSTDHAALCVLLVDGQVAALGHGSATASFRKGQQVRWIVRTRRRKATFALCEHRNGREKLVATGPCEAVITSGRHVWQTRKRKAASPPAARNDTPPRPTTSEGHGLDELVRIAL